MKVAEKYKQTELGLIPSDWEVKELGTILTFGSGRDYKQLQNGKIPVYGTGGVMTYVDEFLYDGMSVGIGRKGTIDKPVFLEGKFWTVDTLFYTHQFINTNPKFIYYKFCLIKWKEYNEASGVPSLNKNTLQKIKIAFPELAEQTAIATALSNADALISSLEKLIAKKRNIKQGAMQKLLQPKEGWEVKKLGEIVNNIQLGGNYPNGEANTNYPLIKMGNIQRGFISTYKIEYIIGDCIPEKRDKLKYGDVLFNTRNTLELVGKVSIWRNELFEAYFNSNLMRFQFNPEFISSNFFMNYVFNTRNSISKLKDIATGTTSVAAIYTRDLLKIEMTIPSKEEQTRIASILSDMDKELTVLESKLEKYRKIKLGMMQNLLTGKIRLV